MKPYTDTMRHVPYILIGLLVLCIFALIAVPQFLKIMHAHVTWWSLIILIISLLLPGLLIKSWFRRFIIVGSFLVFPLYVIAMSIHYAVIEPMAVNVSAIGSFFISPYGAVVFALEILFFATTVIVGLSAIGVKLSFVYEPNPKPSTYDLTSDITISPRAILGYLVFLVIAVCLGLFILGQFTLQHKAVDPAALVQLHTHIGIFALGFLMIILAMNALGVKQKIITLAENLGIISLAVTVLGFLAFIYLGMPSIVWVAPAMLYFVVLAIGWLSTLGKFGLKPDGEHFNFVRVSMAVIWGALLLFVLAGPYLALQYDTTSNVTVSYKQTSGAPYIGAYPDPEKYPGSAPNVHTPRGVENFHLSPSGWAHTAIFWLVVILLFGPRIFGGIGAPHLLFMLATIIPMAPIINSIGRIGAWSGLAFGIGPLYLVGHPLKTLNVLILLIVTILWIRFAKQQDRV